jgi:hypothetical protein
MKIEKKEIEGLIIFNHFFKNKLSKFVNKNASQSS